MYVHAYLSWRMLFIDTMGNTEVHGTALSSREKRDITAFATVECISLDTKLAIPTYTCCKT